MDDIPSATLPKHDRQRIQIQTQVPNTNYHKLSEPTQESDSSLSSAIDEDENKSENDGRDYCLFRHRSPQIWTQDDIDEQVFEMEKLMRHLIMKTKIYGNSNQCKLHPTNWIQLEKCPINNYFPVIINRNEIVAISEKTNDIYKYNVNMNTWTQLVKYPSDMQIIYHTVCYNDNDNTLCIYDGTNMITLDLNTNQFEQFVQPDYDCICDTGAVSIVMDGKVHLIGGCCGKKHVIWTRMNCFVEQWEFKEWETGNAAPSLIHIKSENILLLLGGYDNGPSDTIWKYSLNKQYWQKWNELKLPHPLNSFGAVLTANEKYLIILGGIDGKDTSNKIYVVDLNNMLWKLSSIQCPVANAMTAVMVSNKEDTLIVFGYLRNLRIDLPQDIINLILDWYHMEYIHLFTRTIESATSHWKIDCNQIIDSIKY